jgi:hypothetical protein
MMHVSWTFAVLCRQLRRRCRHHRRLRRRRHLVQKTSACRCPMRASSTSVVLCRQWHRRRRRLHRLHDAWTTSACLWPMFARWTFAALSNRPRLLCRRHRHRHCRRHRRLCSQVLRLRCLLVCRSARLLRPPRRYPWRHRRLRCHRPTLPSRTTFLRRSRSTLQPPHTPSTSPCLPRRSNLPRRVQRARPGMRSTVRSPRSNSGAERTLTLLCSRPMFVIPLEQ